MNQRAVSDPFMLFQASVSDERKELETVEGNLLLTEETLIQ